MKFAKGLLVFNTFIFLILGVSFSSPAEASKQIAYTLQTAPGSAVFQIRCPYQSVGLRTFVLNRPRRYVVDLISKAPVSLRVPQNVLPATESPLEKIQIASHRDFLRLVFHLAHARKIVRNVDGEGSSFTFSFTDPEVSARALTMASSSAAPTSSSSSQPESHDPLSENLHARGRNTHQAGPALFSPILTCHSADLPPAASGRQNQGKAVSHSYQSFQQFPSINGFLEVRGAADTSRDDSLEHARSFRKRFHVESKIPLSENASKMYAVVSGRSDLLWFGTRSDWNAWDLDLHEGYLHWSDGPLEIRLGKQIVRWGKTDQLSPVDVLNPEDLREGITWEMEDRKIPVWMSRLRAFRGPFSLEAVFVPFFEPHDMNIFGTDWAVFRHLKRAVTEWTGVPDEVKESVEGIRAHRLEPARTLENVQYGTRLTTGIHGWDLAVSAFYGFDPSPHIARFPVENIRVDAAVSRETIERALGSGVFTGKDVEMQYKRSRMLGFDFETTWKNLGFRGEAAYFSGRSFLTESLTSTAQPVFLTVLGADYAGFQGWYANLQIAYERIRGDTDGILYFQRENLSLNGEISKELLRGDLQARLRYLVILTDGSSYWNPSLTYLRFRPLSFTFGLNFFAGPADSFMGFYGDNDQVHMTLRYDF